MKIHVKEVKPEGVERNHLALDGSQWWSPVNMVQNVWVL
jgi:hypothetical protein